MQRGGWLVLVVLLGGVVSVWQPWSARAQQTPAVQWIWFNEGDPAASAPAEARYFRKVFRLERPTPDSLEKAELEITADDEFTVWINDVEAGTGDTWQRVFRFDVKKHLVGGNNVIAVEARNTSVSPAALMVRLSYTRTGKPRETLVSDGSWKANKTSAKDWRKPAFDDKDWTAVKVIGPFGKTAPWNNVADAGGPPGKECFHVPEGFVSRT
jgi:alpha-L-rhamnosidase